MGSRSSYTCLDAVYLFLSSFPLSLETNVDTGSFCEFSGLMLVYQIRFRLNCALFVILLCHSILHVSICAFPDVGTTKPKILRNKEEEGCEIEREYAVQLCHIYGWFNVNWLFVLWYHFASWCFSCDCCTCFFFVGIHPRVHNLSSDIIHCGSTSATLCLQVAAPQHNDHNTDHRPCSAKQKIVINFLFAYLLLPFAFYCRSLYLKLNEKINEQPSLNLLQTHWRCNVDTMHVPRRRHMPIDMRKTRTTRLRLCMYFLRWFRQNIFYYHSLRICDSLLYFQLISAE